MTLALGIGWFGHNEWLGFVEARTFIASRSIFRGVDEVWFHGTCSGVAVVLATTIEEKENQKDYHKTRHSSNDAACEKQVTNSKDNRSIYEPIMAPVLPDPPLLLSGIRY